MKIKVGVIVNNYKTLNDSLIKDFKGKEFVKINKSLKYSKAYKVCTSISFVVLGTSLIPSLSDERFMISVAGIAGILFFENKSRNITNYVKEMSDSFEENFKKYLGTEELINFRKKLLGDLKSNSLTKRDYLTILREELQLIFSLIKYECENEFKVDIITYKNSIEDVFNILRVSLDEGFISKEDFKSLERKWHSDMQYICNQYDRTELEVDLKYLQRIPTNMKKEV